MHCFRVYYSYMKMTKLIRVFILATIFCGVSAHSSEAYFTTSQSATLIPNSHTGLFTIDYSFGMPNREVSLPVDAVRSSEKLNTVVSYSILDEDENEVSGKTTSIVLSNASIDSKKMYSIPKGSSKKFKLVTLFTPDVYDAHKKYRLQVTYLPFNFDGVQQLQLNPSELQYYTTKLISL